MKQRYIPIQEKIDSIKVRPGATNKLVLSEEIFLNLRADISKYYEAHIADGWILLEPIPTIDVG